MSTIKLSGVAALVVRKLPTRYRSKVGLVTAALGVAVSVASIVATDYPEVAVVIQALTALGFVEKPVEAQE